MCKSNKSSCSLYTKRMLSDSFVTRITFFVLLTMEKNLLERITSNPKVCGGKPCIRGMRIRVADILELLAAGLSSHQIIAEELPDLEEADISACLLYAASKVNHPVLAAA
jgi:uncharacterized protein (DUF433 family)